MACHTGNRRFPSVEELSLGMAQMTLLGTPVGSGIFDSVETLADRMGELKINDKSKVAGLASVWVASRYNPFQGGALFKSHLRCNSLKKIIYRTDRNKCVKTAKVYLDRGGPPQAEDWEKLFECAIGLLAKQDWGDSQFREETALRLVVAAGGEVKRDACNAGAGGAEDGDSDTEEEPLEKVMERATRRIIEETARLSKRRRPEAMEAALELRDSFKILSAQGGPFSKLNKDEKTRWVTAFSKCLQPILDLNEGRLLYDYVKQVGSR
uniref:Uncharacterized protein n=1 Tax=Quaranjavirus quaranfilense TaxID=688436 RepID=A0A3Q8GZ16_9ORTO|nr:hypothetical protein [Quaranjavirus quaranfilense]